jgi:AcrR family transcriptional regulator
VSAYLPWGDVAATERIPASERRAEILEVSLSLFARHGLHGVTTRQIAEAAGISEALLYRHFRSKDELFEELQRNCLSVVTRVAERMLHIPPSTQALVLAVYYMMSQIMRSCGLGERAADLRRLMLTSMATDGRFARGFLQANMGRYIPKFVECIEAAARSGDLVDKPSHAAVQVWFAHHLAAQLGETHLAVPPVVEHGLDLDTLIEEAVRFALRGLGLKPEAIARHFNPQALALLIDGLGP